MDWLTGITFFMIRDRRRVVGASARLDRGSAQSGGTLQFRVSRKPPAECLVTSMAGVAKGFKFGQDRLPTRYT